MEEDERLKTGLKLFNEGAYYEGHEYFEELWLEANLASDRSGYLFCVRLAAAFVHLTNQSFSGLFMLQQAKAQLADGLDLSQILIAGDLAEALESAIAKLETCSREKLEGFAASRPIQLKISLSAL